MRHGNRMRVMRKFLAAAALFAAAGFAQDRPAHILIAYYSQTGNTEKLAGAIGKGAASVKGAEIAPAACRRGRRHRATCTIYCRRHFASNQSNRSAVAICCNTRSQALGLLALQTQFSRASRVCRSGHRSVLSHPSATAKVVFPE